MKETNAIGPLDLSLLLNSKVEVVARRLRSFLSQGGFKNNFDPVHGAFPRIVEGDRPDDEILSSVREAAQRRGMDADWCDNLESVTRGLSGFFRSKKSRWHKLGVPVMEFGGVEVPLTTGGYARRDETSRAAYVGLVVLRSTFPGQTPRAEACRNLASLIHHTQQRRMRDQLFGSTAHRMPNVELLIRKPAIGSRVAFEHLSGDAIELMSEPELERLLSTFLEALDLLGSRRVSVLRAKYGPKRSPKGFGGPTLFDL